MPRGIVQERIGQEMLLLMRQAKLHTLQTHSSRPMIPAAGPARTDSRVRSMLYRIFSCAR